MGQLCPEYSSFLLGNGSTLSRVLLLLLGNGSTLPRVLLLLLLHMVYGGVGGVYPEWCRREGVRRYQARVVHHPGYTTPVYPPSVRPPGANRVVTSGQNLPVKEEPP